MSEHLSQDLAERYRFRNMSKAELISADEHLASCRECREMLGNREDLRAQVNSLRANLEESLTAEHVDYEQLEAYVEGTLGAAERETVDAHFKSCSLCSEELRDLQAFGEPASNSRVPEPARLNLVFAGLRAAWRPANRWAIAAGVVIAVAIGIRVAHKPSTIVHEPEEIATRVPATVSKPPEAFLTPFSYLPSELQAVIATAIANQHIQAPMGLSELAVRRGAEESSVALLTPVGTVVYRTTPVFLWEAISKADGYRVQVRDSRQNPVESSPVLTGTSWKSTATLRRGETYVWRVILVVGGVEVEESALDVSQAHFRVLDEPQLRQLTLVHPEDHLARGILLAHAGVLEEAAEEFRAVAPSDPNHAMAAKFEQEARATIARRQAGL